MSIGYGRRGSPEDMAYSDGYDDAVRNLRAELEKERAMVDTLEVALKFAKLNTNLCDDHEKGNDVPFCENDCEVRRRSIEALAKLKAHREWK